MLTPPPATTSQRVLSCGRCGYDLRGLPRDARCPECGTPLVLSLYGDYLRHQPPAWIERLVQGSGLLIASQIGWLVVSGYWLARHGSYDWNVMVSSPVTGVVVPLLLTATNLVGVVLLTAPHPQQLDSLLSPRRLWRVLTAVMTVLGVMGYLPALREPPEARFWVPFGALQATTSLTWGAFVLTVALRLPNPRLGVEALLVAGATALIEATLYVYPWFVVMWPFGRGITLRGQEGTMQVVLWGLGGYALFVMVRLYLALAAARETAAGAADSSAAA
jgi:hypothetical protein